ncbi:MAG: sigma-70 family RNA polymerase sigma factor [Verrucomicrobiota bacterium]
MNTATGIRITAFCLQSNLSGAGRFSTYCLVEVIDLSALQQGDADAWQAAFRSFYPYAFAAAQQKLTSFPGDVEDVAIEALEQLVDKVKELSSAEMLKPMLICIAERLAISHIREQLAKKRGSGKVESLNKPDEDVIDPPDPLDALDRVHQSELAVVLAGLQKDLKPEWNDIIQDFFFDRLKYEEIAAKRNLAVGSVGVYLKRALGVLQSKMSQQPKLQAELLTLIRCLFCL